MGVVRDLVKATASGVSYSDLKNPALWLLDLAGGRRTASGERVSHQSAMALSAYYASIRNLSEDLSKLPLEVRERRGGGKRGSDERYDHPASLVLQQPNPIMSGFEFRRTVQHRALGWGNGYAEVVRNGMGEVVELWPIHPERIRPEVQPDGRSVLYHWWSPGFEPVTLTPAQVMHIRGLGDGIVGYSLLSLMAESVGRGLAAQRHGAAYFGEGATKRLVASVKQKMNPDSRAQLRKRIKGDQETDPVGYRRIPILEGDVTLTDLGVNPKDAQYIETEDLTVEDLARWFRMSLSKLQFDKRAKGWSTLDAQQRDYVTDALLGWGITWEGECRLKLLAPNERAALFLKHNFNALLRGDNSGRSAYYTAAFMRGELSVNEIRDLEDLNPIDDPKADMHYVPVHLQPVEALPEPEPKLDEGDGVEDEEPDEEQDDDAPEEETEEGEEGAEEDGEPEGPELPDGMPFGTAVEVMRPVILDSVRRVLRKESHSLARALSRHGANQVAFDAWADGYYPKVRRELVEGLVPVVLTLSALSGSDLAGAEGVLEGVAEQMLGPATGATAKDRLDGTEMVRAGQITSKLTEALTGEE